MKQKAKRYVLTLLLFVFLSLLNFSPAIAAGLNIHYLDVNQGLSILVESNGDYLIYDGGGRQSSSFVVAYLKKQGIDSLSYIVSSHYDEDHISGLIGCLNVFQVDNVIGPDYVHDSSLYDSFMAGVKKQNLCVTHPNVGDSFSLGDATFTVLGPTTTYADSNNNSIVLKVVYGDTAFLFLGDAEFGSEYDMLSSSLDLSCDVICPAHHGSSSSTSWELLDAAAPKSAVISCGTDNKYSHPHQETMSKLEDLGIEVFRTDMQGTIIASSNGETITWSLAPCNDYSPGNTFEDEQPSVVENQPSVVENAEGSADYVLNTNTHKFHYPYCGSVSQMKDKNKQLYTGDRNTIIQQGYQPCKNCNP